MNARLRHALENPVNSASGDLSPYRTIDEQSDGNLLVVILAVDR